MSAQKKPALAQQQNHNGIELLELSRESQFDSKAIGVCTHIEPFAILDFALTTSMRHFVHPTTPTYNQELDTAALMIQDPGLFLKHPLSSVLNPKNAGVKIERKLSQFEFKFSKMTEKPRLLDELQNFLRRHTRAVSLVSEILISADELFTNAVINAPRESLGIPKKSLWRDSKDIEMTPGNLGTITATVVGQRIVMACHDPYGSLNLKNLIQRIKNCYIQGVDRTINMASGGAGIGSFMVYSATASYYAAVQEKQHTLIVCSFPLKMSNKKRTQLSKNVHLIGF